jgi:hypothetical protein
MLTVHIRVNDASTGKPTPVRLRIFDAEGTHYVPFGRLDTFATAPGEDVGGQVQLGQARYFYTDGTCEARLPPRPLHVEVSKGPEYAPLSQQVTLGSGQVSLRLTIHRWTDLRQEGWYAGDARVLDMPPHAALLEGEAEGLAVVNLLARDRPASARSPRALTNVLAFSGTAPALSTDQCHVVVNTLNEHPVLGTLALLNCHRAVYPLRFGAPDGADDWSLADWCDQCHRKKGLVVWPDIERLTPGSPQGEALAALVLGKIDAFEIASFRRTEPENLGVWYRLLDCGVRVPLAGASGKDSNASLVGNVRTYAHIANDQPFSYPAWIEAVRAGRTFITNGPLLTFTCDGQPPGAVISAPPGGKRVSIRVAMQSTLPCQQLEVLSNSSLVAAREPSGAQQASLMETDLEVKQSCWIAARCWSEAGAYAQTSPVYVDVEEHPLRPSNETAAPFLAVLDQTLAWLDAQARCPSEKHRELLRATIEEAKTGVRSQESGVRSQGSDFPHPDC